MSADPGRRNFLVKGTMMAGGLLIGFHMGSGMQAARAAHGEAAPFSPNAFLRIGTDGVITVLHGKTELGQGVHTALPMLVAEELEADWTAVRFAPTPTGEAYNSTISPSQFTGGSLSVWTSYEQLRKAGAAARLMLVAAAARQWGVAPESCRAQLGRVHHDASGKSATYGELALAAAEMPLPLSIPLKDPADFRLIGKPTRRLDSAEKVFARSVFGLDFKVPGMLTAVVLRSPTFGGTLKSFDAAKALAVPGVVAVEKVPSGVAVIADGAASALLGRRALVAEWEPGPDAGLSSEGLLARYEALAQTPGAPAARRGDPEAAKGGAAKTLRAAYTLPYLAHAPMEPLNCAVDLTKDACSVWTGTQSQTMDRKAAADAAGLKTEQVSLHTLMAGGGFGRRASSTGDFVSEAVEVAKKAKAPVKVMWTREDDIQGGYYRPFSHNVLEAGLKPDGSPLYWTHRIVGQSILAGTPFADSMVKDGIDFTSVEGASNLPYAVENLLVDLHSPRLSVPVLWWRSVGHSIQAFTTESFIDELAHLAGADPVAYRLALLKDEPRWRGVLETAAEKSGWGGALPQGRARGVAVHESFGSFVAQVAEVSVEAQGRVRVHRVTCAVDCGIVVNPLTIEAQMQGAVAYGLTAALYGRISFKDGQVEQRNFNNYKILPFSEMPRVDVHIVAGREKPGGIGEPGTPPIAPAVANALFALTGKRLRGLPIDPKALAAG